MNTTLIETCNGNKYKIQGNVIITKLCKQAEFRGGLGFGII
jgi:hypothetical protein